MWNLRSTSALLWSSVLRKHPRLKVIAPAIVAHQDSSHSPWASFTLFSKGNFIFITTMFASTALLRKTMRRKVMSEKEKKKKTDEAVSNRQLSFK